MMGGAAVQRIGKIDIEKYKVVSDRIRTDEVVITDERIQHIRERHPQDFERYSVYIKIYWKIHNTYWRPINQTQHLS